MLEIVDDELFTPVLAYSSLIAILQSTERQFGSQTVKLSAWIETDVERTHQHRRHLFRTSKRRSLPPRWWPRRLSFLMSNDFEDIEIDNIHVSLEAVESSIERPTSPRMARYR